METVQTKRYEVIDEEISEKSNSAINFMGDCSKLWEENKILWELLSKMLSTTVKHTQRHS